MSRGTRRSTPGTLAQAPRDASAVRTLALPDVAHRIDLLIAAVFGTSYRLRTAQAPAHATFLAKAFHRRERPRAERAIPATDGV